MPSGPRTGVMRSHADAPWMSFWIQTLFEHFDGRLELDIEVTGQVEDEGAVEIIWERPMRGFRFPGAGWNVRMATFDGVTRKARMFRRD